MSNILLSGVAYYQSGFHSNCNVIYYNGRDDVYDFALAKA